MTNQPNKQELLDSFTQHILNQSEEEFRTNLLKWQNLVAGDVSDNYKDVKLLLEWKAWAEKKLLTLTNRTVELKEANNEIEERLSRLEKCTKLDPNYEVFPVNGRLRDLDKRLVDASKKLELLEEVNARIDANLAKHEKMIEHIQRTVTCAQTS